MKKRILVTGGAGFIGHHLVNHLLVNTDWDIVIIDKLTYASSGFDRLRDVNCFTGERVKIFTADFAYEIKDGILSEMGNIDYIVHMGAETHVDNSIKDPEPFVMSNVVGTMRILNLARRIKPEKMLYFSTDEVFGSAPNGVLYKEWDRYSSNNPYAATKAGGEELCLAYANTYKTPVLISHTMNVFGERQHWEKFVPMIIRNVLLGEEVTIHADPTGKIPGSRFYIHARNVASAVLFLLDKGKARDKYNVVGEREITNLEMAQAIARILDKDLIYKMVNFHESRPGHDLRYALDGSKMKEMGWRIPVGFEDSLEKTIKWSLQNKKWLNLNEKM